MNKYECLPLGVVLERRRSNHPWQDHAWRPVGVVPGAAACDPRGAWTLMRQGDDWAHYLAGTLPLELFRKETESYRVNLAQHPPRIYVVLRSGEAADSAHEVIPFMVTASPDEAQKYLIGGEEIVEGLSMPPEVTAFVEAFVAQHHVDEPFVKRKRKEVALDRIGFGKTPPVRARRRGQGHG